MPNRLEDLERMADELAKTGDAPDAAKETLELVMKIRQMNMYAEVISARLNGVWHAMEWWQDGDYGEEQLKKAVIEYREQQPGGGKA